MRTELVMYFILISAAAIANGLSDSVYSNYFKEVYKVTAFQRGLIEFPRELPGLLCALVIGLFGFVGDLRLALIAQVLAFAGVTRSESGWIGLGSGAVHADGYGKVCLPALDCMGRE
jgi:hypothetical protein